MTMSAARLGNRSALAAGVVACAVIQTGPVNVPALRIAPFTGKIYQSQNKARHVDHV